MKRKIGKTIILDGDNIRNLFKKIHLNFGFSRKERDKAAIPKIELFKLILKNNINIIYPTIMLGHSKDIIKKWDKEIKNLIKIHIKSNINEIIRFKIKKNFYEINKNVVGKDIKPIFPKNPTIEVKNNFKKNINILSDEVMKKFDKIFK